MPTTQEHIRLSEMLEAADNAATALSAAVRALFPDESSRPQRAVAMIEGGLTKIRTELERRVPAEVDERLHEGGLYDGDHDRRSAAREMAISLDSHQNV